MASCILRRTAFAGLRKLISARTPTNISRGSRRFIFSSARLLEKFFTDKHEWLDIPEGQDIGTVGITDYAQDKLGDVVFIMLPEMGQVLEADGEAGVLESVKAASDIFSPVSGEVTDINSGITESPEKINADPYGEGWLYKIKLSEPKELEKLMTEDGYNEYLKTQD